VSEVTRILDRVSQGEAQTAEELLPLVYEELRKLAAHKMANEAPGQTLQPTALVHEAWLRLVGSADQRWNGRGHFFAAAAEAMRRILIEVARRKQRQRHGGGQEREELDESHLILERPSDEMLAVNQALERLTQEDALASDVVKLRDHSSVGCSHHPRRSRSRSVWSAVPRGTAFDGLEPHGALRVPRPQHGEQPT
jgi:RNA polymerase sigma factor (TIGR02999 family)